MNYLPGWASNLDPLDLSLPSSQAYRCEPPAPGFLLSFFIINNFVHLKFPCELLFSEKLLHVFWPFIY
jgi:hypothetical protein